MRVALLVPLYSIISLLSICFPQTAVYLHPWLDTAQANSLVSYFLLVCEYVSPDGNERDLFFATVEIQDKIAARKGKIDDLAWFKVSFQRPDHSCQIADYVSYRNAGLTSFNTLSWPYSSRWQHVLLRDLVCIVSMSPKSIMPSYG